MVATLLRLKFRLLVNGLKRSTAQLIGAIIGLVFVIGGGVLLIVGGLAASLATSEYLGVVGQVVILIGAILLLGWTIIPPLFFGVDPTLDPQRFATLNVPPRSLAIGLVLSGFIGLPGLLTVCFAVGTALVWVRQPAALVPALLGGLAGALLAIALSRLVTGALAGALASRRGRDLAGIGSVLVIVLLSIGVQFVSNSMGALAEDGDLTGAVLHTLAFADWAAWTPFGAPWAIGPAAAAGDWGRAALLLAVSAAYLVAIVWLWSVAMRRAIVRPPSATGSKARTDNQVLTFVRRWALRPSWRPVAAVTARCWRYWVSDPRYLTSIIMMPLMAVMMIVMSLVVHEVSFIVAAGPLLMAFVAAMMLSNDIGFDSTAFWLHVFAPVSGRTDRAGRLWASSLWFLPILALATVVCLAVGGLWQYWPPLVGVSLALAYGGLGSGLVSSAIATTPCPLPGESPMASKSGSAALQMAVAFGVMGASLLLATPAIVFGVLALVTSPMWGWVALGVGIVTAVGASLIGIHAGGSILDRRKLALLGQLVAQDS